ncbi:MAG TPA: radical SAM protein [Pirellulales bacterium]|nr:radical SAM protein [Pirellulales bacterium]
MSCDAPSVPISHLDQLWFQVAGTLCNLACGHCFISCSPKNDTFGFLSFDTIRRCLAESVALGVKEYYFTGGEPFLHPQMTEILIETLGYGPATVLTNGTRFDDASLAALARAADGSLYSLEFRVSIDGYSPETNDPIRGAGTFDRAMRGVGMLVRHDFLPIVTVARTWPDDDEDVVLARFGEALYGVGCRRPRLKVLPTLRIGAEAQRTRGYDQTERVSTEMMAGFDTSQLICEHSRIVTDRGVYVCPILLDSPDARLGETLADALVPYQIKHGACFTCYQYGAICANPGGAEGGGARRNDEGKRG